MGTGRKSQLTRDSRGSALITAADSLARNLRSLSQPNASFSTPKKTNDQKTIPMRTRSSNTGLAAENKIQQPNTPLIRDSKILYVSDDDFVTIEKGPTHQSMDNQPSKCSCCNTNNSTKMGLMAASFGLFGGGVYSYSAATAAGIESTAPLIGITLGGGILCACCWLCICKQIASPTCDEETPKEKALNQEKFDEEHHWKKAELKSVPEKIKENLKSGMGLNCGGFSRFWHSYDQKIKPSDQKDSSESDSLISSTHAISDAAQQQSLSDAAALEQYRSLTLSGGAFPTSRTSS